MLHEIDLNDCISLSEILMPWHPTVHEGIEKFSAF